MDFICDGNVSEDEEILTWDIDFDHFALIWIGNQLYVGTFADRLNNWKPRKITTVKVFSVFLSTSFRTSWSPEV